jgi:hypothetical protein
MALLAIGPVSTSLACRLQCNLKMQNTRVSQLGDPLQVGVQGRRVVQDRGLPAGLLSARRSSLPRIPRKIPITSTTRDLCPLGWTKTIMLRSLGPKPAYSPVRPWRITERQESSCPLKRKPADPSPVYVSSSGISRPETSPYPSLPGVEGAPDTSRVTPARFPGSISISKNSSIRYC